MVFHSLVNAEGKRFAQVPRSLIGFVRCKNYLLYKAWILNIRLRFSARYPKMRNLF